MKARCGLLTCLCVFVFMGCSWKGGEHWSFEKKIDKIEDYHRKFGEIAVSKPIFAEKEDFFKFDLGLTAKDIYEDIGFQVAGRFGSADVAGFRGAFSFEAPSIPERTIQPVGRQIAYALTESLINSVTTNPTHENTAIVADLLKASVGALAPTTQPITLPARQPTSAPALPENEAAARANALTDAMKIFSGVEASKLKIRSRDRATEAANDYYHMQLLELFSNPSTQFSPKGFTAVLAVANISVAPGEVTREGFIAEVVLRFSLADKDGRFIDYLESPFSVYPSIVGQNTNIQSLAAFQRDLALQLRSAGYWAAANLIYEKSLQNQSNVAAVNQIVTLSSAIRGSGDQIAFRVRGQYNPVDLPSYDIKKRAEAAFLLQEISFPIVIGFRLPDTSQRAILERLARKLKRLAETGSTGGGSGMHAPLEVPFWAGIESMSESDVTKDATPDENHPNTKKLLAEIRDNLRLRLDVVTHWIPVSESVARKVDWWYPELTKYEGRYRAKVSDSLRQQARQDLNALGVSDSSRGGDLDHIREIQWLRTVAGDSEYSILDGYVFMIRPILKAPKDKPEPPSIASVFPTKLPSDRPSFVVVTGLNLKDAEFVFGPVAGETKKVVGGGKAALVRVDPVPLNRSPIPSGTEHVFAVGPGGRSPKSASLVVEFEAMPNPKTKIRTTHPWGAEETTIEEEFGGVKKNVFLPPPPPQKK